VERGEHVLIDGLDGDGAERVVAHGFEQGARVGAVCLVAEHVGAHGVRRQQHDVVALALGLAAPEVGGPAGFHHARGGRLLGEVGGELAAGRASAW
jgi:hypothetical protein